MQAVEIEVRSGTMSSSVFRRLKTKVGDPLRKENIDADLRMFFKEVGLSCRKMFAV